MWILPKNHPLYSVYVQDFSSDLTEDLKQHWEESPEPLLMWKSKPLSWTTLLRQWKSVYWMRHLCGRILKPSLGTSFEERWIGSLEDTHVSRLVLQDQEKELTIPATYIHTYPQALEQLDLWGVSSKTLVDILHSGMSLSGETYNLWVIELRKEYSQRKKSERHTEESDSLSSQSWGTPRAFMHKDALEDRNKGNLGEQIMNPLNWAIPKTVREKKLKSGKVRVNCDCGHSYITTEDKYLMMICPSCKMIHSGTVTIGLQDKDHNSTISKNRAQLNPAWVAQLMGTTLEKIFFVGKVTE